ncbi:T9SS type A sorting domain-containing protein [Larkinella sp. VNQ87]|uniref:T9SS type A sorting domain-containing protein n=1 Tax=Larkinella sp. VNQ87 TaxID=3400921 RepID=UPI003C00B492
MKAIPFLFICLIGLFGGLAVAQKKVPYSFRYQDGPHQADTSGQGQLRFLTQVTQPTTTLLRLYFAGTQLGDNSYLVLEGTDGARQELRKPDLENWHYSSAYFNGQSVKVSLFAAAGERNSVQISELKVTDPQAVPNRNGRPATGDLGASARTAASTTTTNVTETHPHAKAVGRFTNGVESWGTGWIAPNGAIVTSSITSNKVKNESYDVIEFNVPSSIGFTVQHPSPQDQYPVSTASNDVVESNRVVLFNVWVDGSHSSVGQAASYAILTPLPNSTGLRPGERQGEYFRISTNPRSSDIHDAGNVPADVLHYGASPGDNYNGQYRTLHVYPTSLMEQNEYLSTNLELGGDRDFFVLYGGAGLVNMVGAGPAGSDRGAPVTYGGTNIAMGVHEYGNTDLPSVGVGFRDDEFRNDLARFFTEKSAYLDWNGVSNQPNGQIHKPYLTVQQAAQHAPNEYTVYVAGGTYPGAVTFNRPLTLRAPVGTVRIGASPVGARKAAGPTIPPHWLEEGPSFDRESAENRRVRVWPNPFKEQTEINYPFAEGGPVSVRILSTAGVPIATLAASGQTGVSWNGTDQSGTPVPAGLYLVQVNDGKQIITTRVLKK